FRQRTPHGEIRWLHCRSAPRRLPDGRTIWDGIAVDITGQKRAEEGRRESEEQFRRIVETANEGIWVLDAEARIHFVNPRMAQMLGYQVQDLLGRYKWDFLFEEDQERMHQLFERRRAGISEQADVRFRRRDGREVWTLQSARALIDAEGRFQGALDM